MNGYHASTLGEARVLISLLDLFANSFRFPFICMLLSFVHDMTFCFVSFSSLMRIIKFSFVAQATNILAGSLSLFFGPFGKDFGWQK
jgi:hypothetical protein